MLDTQQKTNQFKNIAVAIVKDDNGKVLLVKTPVDLEVDEDEAWGFPSNIIVPGATYTETFASDVLENTGCIVEATALISSEKVHSLGLHFEYVECKIVCIDSSYKRKSSRYHKWVQSSKLKDHFIGNFNEDLDEFFDSI